MPEPIIHIENVHKHFGHIHALRGINLDIQPGEVVVILGPSGSGKSTLLRCINHLEVYNSGKIVVDGILLKSAQNINNVRREVGMVFQSFNLFPHLTAMDNLILAQQKVRKRPIAEARSVAAKLLEKVGITDKANAYPGQLSGGQQQRVAIARAIVSDPSILVADEPTGDLDRVSAGEVLTLMGRLNSEFGKTIIMVTHDPRAAEKANIILHLEKGVMVNALP